ncbi:uncharacterized protein LOC132740394 isoform X2 [Ruditapes philippinarum]|nr:uncharacterized protein LOC132740394 isoform X2 [Ruditapes philippinarum]
MADNYYRLVTFVVNICPKPLRALFVSKAESDPNHLYTSVKDYLQIRESDIRKIRQIRPDQLNLIYPHFGSVDIENWDVTLLILLLKELFPNRLQQNERDCLHDITEIRNELQHIASTELVTDKEFNIAWKRLRDAVVKLKTLSGSTTLVAIEDEIKSVLHGNMPSLADVLNTWLKSLYHEQNKKFSDKISELAEEIKNLKEKLQLQHTELTKKVTTAKENSKESKKILKNASVKRKGRSGVAEKRFKVFDDKIDRMKGKLARALLEENDCKENFKDAISEILQQLTDNHRVIVTGFDNKLTYKCALAAVQERKYNRNDQCLEINNPSDWKRICSEDAQFVLFREPFGISTYDSHKVEVMCEEFDSMIQATDDDNDDVIDIVIVTNQRLLNEVTRRNEHDMLSPSSTVYIDSTTEKSTDENITADDTVHGNLLEMSRMFKKEYKLKEFNSKAKEKAESIFLKHSMVVIVGPTGSGKTSLSFELLSSYDLSNGEDNFLVISNPGELKYIKFSLRPVIIIKIYGQTSKWYSQFDRLYAAVKARQIAVITTIGLKTFQMMQANMLSHPVLEHVVRMPGSEGLNEERIDFDVKTDGTSSNVLHEGNIAHEDTNIDEQRLRRVISVRNYKIKHDTLEDGCYINDVSVLPTGDILLAASNMSKLIKVNKHYDVISTLSLNNELYLVNVCHIGNNIAVVLGFRNLLFVDVTGNMSLIRSVSTNHGYNSFTCHSDKLYVADIHSVHVYSTDGEYIKQLYTSEDKEYMYTYTDIAVSNDGSMIYILNRSNKLTTIDSSGNHLFTLDIPDIQPFNIYQNQICVDDQGFIFVLGEHIINVDEDEEEGTSTIIQISPDGQKSYGALIEIEGSDYRSIQFDSKKSALVLSGKLKMIKVLKLR